MEKSSLKAARPLTQGIIVESIGLYLKGLSRNVWLQDDVNFGYALPQYRLGVDSLPHKHQAKLVRLLALYRLVGNTEV